MQEKMNLDILMQYFVQYGAIAIFVIVLLEYMNLPGFPAGVIMPLAGVWAARGGIRFPVALLVTVAAGLLGSWILYLLGYVGGGLFLQWYLKKFPGHRQAIDRNFEMLRKKGCVGVFVGKLIPMVRTLISIPAGVLRMDFWKYTVSAVLGVAVWNLFFVGAGYFLGDAVLRYLA